MVSHSIGCIIEGLREISVAIWNSNTKEDFIGMKDNGINYCNFYFLSMF